MPLGIKILELSKIEARNPVLIQGLPGLGYVGKTSLEYMIEKLKPIKFAELYSTHLTFADGNLGININLDGTFSLPKYEFYAHLRDDPNLILLTGDAQPNVLGQYEVAEAVLDFIGRFGCEKIISIGGYSTRFQRDVGTIYAVVDGNVTANDVAKYGVKIAKGGSVTGACGVILGLGIQRKMKCIGLLSSTRGVYPDLEAARSAIYVVSQMLGLDINLEDLDKKIEEMREKIEKLEQLQARMIKRARKEEKEERKERYIT
ncbi:MAG: PAC2 family protein [Candidatus Bathyarchaeia archaeon]